MEQQLNQTQTILHSDPPLEGLCHVAHWYLKYFGRVAEIAAAAAEKVAALELYSKKFKNMTFYYNIWLLYPVFVLWLQTNLTTWFKFTLDGGGGKNGVAPNKSCFDVTPPLFIIAWG